MRGRLSSTVGGGDGERVGAGRGGVPALRDGTCGGGRRQTGPVLLGGVPASALTGAAGG
jgi:hypothetical protein